MGNIHSVQKALESCGADTQVTNKPNDIRLAEKIVLPGVGAFDDAMLALKKQDLILSLNEHVKLGKAFLGICLGMQLLFESSQEAKQSKGLSLLKGEVKRFTDKPGLKVPHIGWNQLKIKNNGCPLLKDIPDNANVYFCHSYYAKPKDAKVTSAICNYGADFTAIAWQNNIYGTQFHPEKSQIIGLKILHNFVKL